MENSVIILRISLAILIGTIIGIEREIKNRPAGMRTHILVCLGACTISLIESNFTACLTSEMNSSIAYNFGRLSAQVISGIGFLGAGTIMFSDRKVTGLTTAASLWNTACLGIAIGYGYYVIAIVGSIFVFLVLIMMQRIIHVRISKKLEVRFVHRVETIEYINKYFEARGIQTVDIDFNVTNMENKNIYTNIYTLHLPSDVSYTEIVNNLSEHANILSIRTTSV
ncbi:MAG: MgtC/SapB family protein [Candidatus Faecivicinus sp.]